MVKLKKAYDDFMPESDATGLYCSDKSLAVQSAVEESDINTIVRRFGLTGQLPSEVAMPRFEDFENVYDYKSCMDMVAEAKNAFMRFPAVVRARFVNDPNELIQFIENPANYKEAVELGVAMPRPQGDTPPGAGGSSPSSPAAAK